MKALFVRKLYLWPRFEAHVKDALNDLPIEVCAASTLPSMEITKLYNSQACNLAARTFQPLSFCLSDIMSC